MRFSVVLLVSVLMGHAALPATAAKRVALVIGNGAYDHAPVLGNPGNDATDIAAALERLDFEVVQVLDAGFETMRQAIRRFGERAAGADVALLFFAGHGVQVDGRNYLLPTTAQLKRKLDLPFETVALDLPMRLMEGSGAKVRIVILDACRDNPMVSGIGRSLGSSRGLSSVETNAAGTLIAFATAPGRVAADGAGRNSPFTAALKLHLETPGVEIRSIFGRVRQSVLAATDRQQLPWVNEAIEGEFFLIPPSVEPEPAVRAPPAVLAPSRDKEVVFWDSIKGSEEWRDFQAYLDQFGDEGTFSALAAIRRDRLRTAADQQQAALPPPQEPEPELEIEEMNALYRVVTRSNIRAGPATSFERISTLPAGREIKVIGKVKGENWYRIALGEGREGFIFGKLIQDEASYEAAQEAKSEGQVAQEARQDAEPEKQDEPEPETAVVTPPKTQVAVGVYAPEPGSVIRDCPECPEMVVIPAGSFMMGSPASEKGRDKDEGPAHRVSVDSFALGKYEVTFEQYDYCVRDGDCPHRTHDVALGRGRQPVFNVTWEDAQSYVRWLSGATGKRYRLASEAEWEYAARHGHDDYGQTCGHANGADRTTRQKYQHWPVTDCRDGYIHTAPVGSFRANHLGLHDMAGNVWEWVEDCWHGSYAGAPSNGQAWLNESGRCAWRVLRGGSWADLFQTFRPANRLRNDPRSRNNRYGFRVARPLDR